MSATETRRQFMPNESVRGLLVCRLGTDRQHAVQAGLSFPTVTSFVDLGSEARSVVPIDGQLEPQSLLLLFDGTYEVLSLLS